MRVSRRQATRDDEEFARSAHHQAYQDVVSRQFGCWDEAVQDTFFRKKWVPRHFEILMLEDIACGYLSAQRRKDHIFLSEIVILPDYQGRGIGSHVLKQEIRVANDAGLPLRLQVLKANRAIELYHRLGFVERGLNDTHIQLVCGTYKPR